MSTYRYEPDQDPRAGGVLEGISLHARMEGDTSPLGRLRTSVAPSPPILPLPCPEAMARVRFTQPLVARSSDGEHSLTVTCPKCQADRNLVLFTNAQRDERTATLACPQGHAWSSHFALLTAHMLTSWG